MADAVTFLKVALVFVIVVWAIRRKAPIGIALASGGVLVAILMGRTAGWVGAQLAGDGGLLLAPCECGSSTARLETTWGLRAAWPRAFATSSAARGFPASCHRRAVERSRSS